MCARACVCWGPLFLWLLVWFCVGGVHSVSKVIYWVPWSIAVIPPRQGLTEPGWAGSQQNPAFLVSLLPTVLAVQTHLFPAVCLFVCFLFCFFNFCFFETVGCPTLPL